jgi:hypothetical protein
MINATTTKKKASATTTTTTTTTSKNNKQHKHWMSLSGNKQGAHKQVHTISSKWRTRSNKQEKKKKKRAIDGDWHCCASKQFSHSHLHHYTAAEAESLPRFLTGHGAASPLTLPFADTDIRAIAVSGFSVLRALIPSLFICVCAAATPQEGWVVEWG